MLEISSHYKGQITELQVAEQFLRRGMQVSKPLVTDSRYDFIIDYQGKLLKIQVKTSRADEKGAFIEFATSTSHTNSNRTINRSYTCDEIDYFVTVWENQCYVVPIEKCGNRVMRLRFKPTNNGQKTNTNMANDFLIDKIFPME